MTLLHPSHFHHHRLHYFTLRYLLPLLLAMLLLFFLASPVHGQVMIDATQLHGEMPGWVDPAYARAVEQTPVIIVEHPPRPVEHIWVPAITRQITERVWVPARYEDRWVLRCTGDDLIRVREYVLVEPGHWESRCREILIVPGHWETRGEILIPDVN